MSIAKNDIGNFDPGFRGRPEDYPMPPDTDKLLFYIQRNQNKNTVVYELNKNAMGNIDERFPMHVYWIRYTDGGELQELNLIQNKLAYGYEARAIDHQTFEFNFVSYTKLKFYIAKIDNKKHQVITNINNKRSILDNVYVYAEEFGVFPIVKYIELYGRELDSRISTYQKIQIEA